MSTGILEQLGLDYFHISTTLMKLEEDKRSVRLEAILNSLVEIRDEVMDLCEFIFFLPDNYELPKDVLDMNFFVNNILETMNWSETIKKIGRYLWDELEEKKFKKYYDAIDNYDLVLHKNYCACDNLKIKYKNTQNILRNEDISTPKFVDLSKCITWRGHKDQLELFLNMLIEEGFVAKPENIEAYYANFVNKEGKSILTILPEKIRLVRYNTELYYLINSLSEAKIISNAGLAKSISEIFVDRKGNPCINYSVQGSQAAPRNKLLLNKIISSVKLHK